VTVLVARAGRNREQGIPPGEFGRGSPFQCMTQTASGPSVLSAANADAVVSVTASPHSGQQPALPANEKLLPQKHATLAMIGTPSAAAA
jgi:hypothetical protein